MIKLLLIDFGESLVHNGAPFPYTADALGTISKFKTELGEKLVMAIVSDFGLPEESDSEAKIQVLEEEFAAILRASGLEPFFRPFEQRVTVSGRAGAIKPDPRIFLTAAARSETGAELPECLFVTEHRPHLLAAQSLGLSILGFGDHLDPLPSFSRWQDAPLLIAEIVAPESLPNQERAISLALREQSEIADFKCLSRDGMTFRGEAGQLVQLTQSGLRELRGSFVRIPVDISVYCNSHGAIEKVIADELSSEDMDEAVAYIRQLLQRGQISEDKGSMQSGTTHAVRTDELGRRIISRQRFSN